MAQHPFLNAALGRGIRGTTHPLAAVLAVCESTVKSLLPEWYEPTIDFCAYKNNTALVVTTSDGNKDFSQYFFGIAHTGKDRPKDAALQINLGNGSLRYCYILNTPANMNMMAECIAARILADARNRKQESTQKLLSR